jgi:hypothetical protein
MSAVSGLLTLADVTSGEEWVSEYQETILVRNAKGLNAGTTLFGLMAKLKSEDAETTEYKWFERDPVTREVYSSNTVASAVTTTAFTFDDGSGNAVYGLLQPGTILRNDSTGEHVRITAYADPNYTLERGFDGTAANVTDNDLWVIITLGKDEGATPIEAVYESADALYNYIQTFNSTVEISNAFKGSKLRTDIDGPLKERRTQALERVARDIELAYFFGTRARKTGTNGHLYYSGGIKDAVDQIGASPAQVLNGNGTTGIPFSDLSDWLASFMTVGSDAKLFLAGPKTYAMFSTYANEARNGFRITGQENVFGMNITAIQTPFGELDLAMHPLFKEITSFNDWGFVVDLGLIVQKVMEKLFLEPNIQANGQDAYKEQFRAKYGLKLKFAEAFAYCYDLSKLV